MSALSAIEPTRLSQEQETLLEPYRDHWKLVRNSTAPADRPAAERGVALAYAAANLAPPERIVWCRSPIGIETSRKATWHEFDPGESVKALVVDRVIRRVAALVDDQIPVRVRVAAGTGLEIEPQYFGASGTLSNALAEAATRVRWNGAARRKAAWARLTRRPLSDYEEFHESRLLQHEALSMLAKCAFLHNVCGAVAETSALQGLWLIVTNAGAMVPHKRVCWLSERHDTLALDISGRLHCATGPAVRYPDGWSLHAWKGVAVPNWMIEDPGQITTRLIDREHNPTIRHCMIDILTPERYVATGAAMRFAEDKVGILWRKQWGDWWNSWAAVEVVNGTPEPDGTRKHYFLQVPTDVRTPTEAVAWTYGMSAQSYASLNLRT
jgi:hypothetical protein